MSKASQLRQKAQGFLKKGKTADAVEAYKKLLQVESRNPNLYNELGDIYLKAGDRIQAVSSFEKAVENYEKVALYNNAVAVCKKILRVVPNRVESIYKLGELKAKQKFTGEASRMFLQYFELVSSDEGGVRPELLLKKAEVVLGMVPDNEELHATVADILSQAGKKIAAAEIYAKLIVKSTGNGDAGNAASYRKKLDPLRDSMNSDEQARIDEMLAESLDVDGDGNLEPDLTVEEIDPNATAETAGSDGPAAADAGAEGAETPEVQAEDEAPPVPEPQIDAAGQEAADEQEITEIPEQAVEAAKEYEIPAGPEPEAGAEAAKEYEIPAGPEPAAGTEAAEEHEIEDAPAADQPEGGEAGVVPVEDELSDILEAEDAANEASEVDTERLTEEIKSEITSDVEEDDFRSHYDLGMAYIEMALYNEAIKELQISSRSEQLQLRSLEMIGHCFLLLDNPRLAVKQLNRGLEIAMSTGGDNLGIHYNLGLAYEALDEPDKAREHFEEVYIVDVTFRDISDKMKKYSTVS